MSIFAGQHIPLASAHPPAPRTNWAGNHTFEARDVLYPSNTEEVQAIVRSATPLKALGVSHSFNNVADTTGTHVSLKRLTSMSLASDRRTVTVGSGVTYGELARWLDPQGYAVHNLASLPHISVVGACATGTHGSGVGNGSLSTAVSAIEFVSGTGEFVRLTRGDADFAGAVIAFGALGIISSISLEVQPRFDIAQGVYENLSFGELEHGLEEILSSGYSVSLFTDWQQHRVTQAWLKRRVEDGHAPEFPARFHGATLQAEKLHPLAGHSAENCTEQLGVPGPWYERLPHFRMDFTPSSGAELQTEYFVAREHGWAAIQAVEELRDQITPHLMVSELRAVAADALWLSMAYERASLAFHFTWKPDWAVVQHILPQVEAKLAPYGARPHWGKLFAMPGEHVRGLYPKFGEFAALREKYDPDRRFENRFLSRLLA